MHPAPSVIFFTVCSGAGYGLLALFTVRALFGWVHDDLWFAALALGLALLLITAGLLASMLHLGHPERAWRALSQWRTSWLSREGALAVATFPAALGFAVGWLIVSPQVGGPTNGLGWVMILAGLTAVLCAATVYATSMIYATLKPVHQWRNGWVAPNFFALAIMTGAVWLQGIERSWQISDDRLSIFCLLAIVCAAALKFGYWNFIDTTRSSSTSETATGLGELGSVRLLDPPHTAENYLLQEMGFRVAQKHRSRLRQLAIAFAFGAPLALTLVVIWGSPAVAISAAAAAIVSATGGVLIERWLFFAEAKHSVTLYYGERTV
ncbi:MAG: dimethyl sulfoxide reductase anchor subunit [Proteobacteria bacterium]|nr:dimethyl sulfoxide reductase anchor subunit [Pseudomonadota bacterium]